MFREGNRRSQPDRQTEPCFTYWVCSVCGATIDGRGNRIEVPRHCRTTTESHGHCESCFEKKYGVNPNKGRVA